MLQQPLVSAIIIFFNEENFLKEAIDSVLAQEYSHWELLLVDDGSTDQSSAIARRYALRYPGNIRYLEHPGHQNRGMSAARHLGVQNAGGEHVAFLDGDDCWLPNKLKRQVEMLNSFPEAAMVCAPLRLWHSWTGKPEDATKDSFYGVQANGKHPFSDKLIRPPRLLCLFLRFEEYIPSGFLIRREVIAQANLYEEVFREAYSDAAALVKICLRWPVYISEESGYLYRQHQASSTYKSWLVGQEAAEKLFYLEWVRAYLREQKVLDPRVWLAFERAFLPLHYPGAYVRFQRGLAWIDRLKRQRRTPGGQNLSG